MKTNSTDSMDGNESMTHDNGGELEDDERDSTEQPRDSADKEPRNPEEFQNMSEVQMEGILADAIDALAEEEGLSDVWSVSFARAGLLTSDNGIVVRIGENEFQIRILRTD